MKSFKQILNDFFRAHREREERARHNAARLRAEQDLYLRDYSGRLYLYHEGRPIIPVSAISGDPFAVLSEARTDSVLFDTQPR